MHVKSKSGRTLYLPTPEEEAEINAGIAADPDTRELPDEWFEQADLYDGEKLVRRGRPPKKAPKVLMSLRYSPEVVEQFRATGNGWQTRMDEALKDWLKTHDPANMDL